MVSLLHMGCLKLNRSVPGMGPNILLAMKEHLMFLDIQRAEKKCIKLLCYSMLCMTWKTEDRIHSLPPKYAIISSDTKNCFQMMSEQNISGKAASGRENALFNEAPICV